MEVFYNKDDIEGQLAQGFKNRYKRKDVVLTGILLARPEDKLARDSILPNLDYWNYRSDYFTDFFCAGYIPRGFVEDTEAIGVTVDGIEWGFSLQAFVEIVEHLEETTGWSYQGDPTIILQNAYFDGEKAHLDYHRCMRMNLRKAIGDKSIGTPTEFAEAVFEFAKKNNENYDDPVWELSDKLGHRVLKRGIKDAFLAWLPKWLSPATREAMHYAVHELEPSG